MKILLSVENFYPRLGGGEVFVDELMTEFNKQGHEVYVIYVGEPKPQSNLNLLPQNRSFAFKNIPLFNRTVIRQYFANLKWKKFLDKKIEEIKPDLIFTQLEYTPSTIDAAKSKDIPVVAFIQNYDHFCPFLYKHKNPGSCKMDCFRCSPIAYKIQHYFSMKYIKWHLESLKKTDLIFSDSKYVSDLLEKRNGVKSIVLHPVLYLDDFIIKNIKNKLTKKYITFINPIKTKGAEIVLEIVKNMPEQDFLVVGGKDKKLIDIFKQQVNVSYMPWCDDMKKVYSQTRILLTPSLWPEPFGRVITEAQINGIPCISSNSGGLPEAVGDGGSVISNVFNVDLWVSTIKKYDDKLYYKNISDLAAQHGQKLLFKNQWSRFIKYLKENKLI
jgi:glycosyltransferase involved in cell wall biosynthesis